MSHNNYDLINSAKISDDIFLIKSDVILSKCRGLDVVSKIDGLLITINFKGSVEHRSHLNNFTLNISENMTSLNLHAN